jgi:hypothetical protein
MTWGNTKERAEKDQVLDVCLRQIDECRPSFIGLPGERYGWAARKFPTAALRHYGWVQHHKGETLTWLKNQGLRNGKGNWYQQNQLMV